MYETAKRVDAIKNVRLYLCFCDGVRVFEYFFRHFRDGTSHAVLLVNGETPTNENKTCFDHLHSRIEIHICESNKPNEVIESLFSLRLTSPAQLLLQ